MTTASDEEIRLALADADPGSLLPALAHLTGDMSLLRSDLRADPMLASLPFGGLTEGQIETIRELALAAIVSWRDAGCPPPAAVGEDGLRRIFDYLTGGLGDPGYMPLLAEELALDARDPRAPRWHRSAVAPDRHFRVAVTGAGMSGILAAHRLMQAGVEVVVLEKNGRVGGTWLENTYPGCRVDVSNHLYSYSFAQRRDWPAHFSTGDELLAYFEGLAGELGVEAHVRFGTEVREARFSDETLTWFLELEGPDGAAVLEADAVVSAVGQLNRPKMPDIPGIENFAGPSFHSARWDHGVDLAGRRVAVIGSAASAIQFVPVIAETAGNVTVFQRTANWLINTPTYLRDVAPGLRWLFENVPLYAEWHRFAILIGSEGFLASTEVDPDWPEQEGSVGPLNEMVRLMATAYLEEQFADRPDLLDAVTPRYPPAAKRPLRDDGTWPRTIKRPNVELVTSAIAGVEAAGVRTGDAMLHEADVIVYATGFEASRFLEPVVVKGSGGRDLHETWGADARAYLGITVPGFPNLFILYGPNTNIVVNGSIIFFSECEVRYLLGCVELLLATGGRALDCRREVHDDYNARIDEGNRRRAWGVSSVNTWYKSESGRISQNWPFALLDYWRQTLAVDPCDYEILGAGERVSGRAQPVAERSVSP